MVRITSTTKYFEGFTQKFYVSLTFGVALRDDSEAWLLNANEKQASTHNFVSLGTKFSYENNGFERLTARGPLLEDLTVLVRVNKYHLCLTSTCTYENNTTMLIAAVNSIS